VTPAPNTAIEIVLAARTRKCLALSRTDRDALERWTRQSTAEYRLVRRSRILLLLADGMSAREVARALRTTRHTVDLWRRRFEAEGVESIRKDRPGRGRKRSR
jgi:DNA-binding NarL/FixJ family response regulator